VFSKTNKTKNRLSLFFPFYFSISIMSVLDLTDSDGGVRPERVLTLVVTSNEQAHAGMHSYDIATALEVDTGLPTVVANLTVGDYAIIECEAGKSLKECNLRVLIESKTEQDLASTLGTPREDQIARLLASGAPQVHIFVRKSYLRRPEDRNRIDAAMTDFNTLYSTIGQKRGVLFNMLPKSDMEHPFGLSHAIKRIIKNLGKDGEQVMITLEQAMSNGTKKKLIEQKDVWVNQLRVVHGVSHGIATALAQKYPTVMSLLRVWKTAGKAVRGGAPAPKKKVRGDPVVTAMELALQDVVVNNKNGKRLGPALSGRIKRAFAPDLEVDD
jgi:ERCC4-type nuclease